jgi:hypothetical protein
MKWMKERDLLIAQTMAFVQSVTGKAPEAATTFNAPVALFSVETSEAPRAATTFPETAALADVAVLADIKSLLAKTPAVAQAPAEASTELPREAPREISRPASLAHPDLREDFQSEIRARVASFRANQERFNREREAYCSATMARVHAALKEIGQPTRPAK